ncbi:MAG TPA: PD-(D/E)XK nuclease family protein, partial [Solirubrobacteraceae bacterium]|nr:PD-(D/E)XK nuclease family protein [Solirubrobacteraceae bacterium]
FYVAMTRAEERLVLSGALKFDGFTAQGGPTGGGPAAWIAPAFVPELGRVLEQGGGEVRRDGVRIAVQIGRPEDRCEPPGTGSDEPSTPRTPPAGPAAPPSATALDAPGPLATPTAPPIATLSYSALQEFHRCGYRFYAERVLGLPPVPEPAWPSGTAVAVRDDATGAAAAGPRSAADRGVLVHALLERLDFRRPAVPSADAVRTAAARAGLRPAPGPAEADELAALVRRFAQSELCARLARATSTRREERFAFPVGSDSAGPLVVGAIDVLAREADPAGGPADQVLIVDYKSDRLAGAAPAQVADAEYSTQRIVYALAALRAGARTVEIAHCFVEQPETPAVATFERSGTAELEQALAGLSRGILSREFAVTPAPHRRVCVRCPAEGGLCSWPLEQTRRESPDQLF